MRYIRVDTGAELERLTNIFYWRGRYFSGLVDAKNNALFDDPDDSFCDHVGLQSSLQRGLIRRANSTTGDT